MTITETCKEATWLKGLFGKVSENLHVTIVFCDSQSAIFNTKDMIHQRKNHIDIQYHSMHDATSLGDIVVCKVSIKENTTIMMTKELI